MFFLGTTAVPKREKIGHRNEEGKKFCFFFCCQGITIYEQTQTRNRKKDKNKKNKKKKRNSIVFRNAVEHFYFFSV